MAKPYESEMSRLSETFTWAASSDIAALRRTVRTAGLSPLRAIGSGGSLTAAHALAAFHQRWAGRMATVATPMEVVGEPIEGGVSTWLISAGGGNVDILAAARSIIASEPAQVAALCGRADSKLAELCAAHPFVDLLLHPPPAGKDGFLATNSLLGFTALLARAYAHEYGARSEWDDTLERVPSTLDHESAVVASWASSTASLWPRPTTIVLYGPATRIGAIDLESKFTEAALGQLQLADYRNFAHGRHHWLAKRGSESAILALTSPEDRALANRTLALIPSDIPRARLDFDGSACAVALTSLVAALRITGWAGMARGLDPGNPGVPQFGRKLYNLSGGLKAPVSHLGTISARDAAAIARKSNIGPGKLAEQGALQRWQELLEAFRTRLRHARFGAVVMDYDGTVVDTRHRFQPPTPSIAAQLIRLLEQSKVLAFATGRGVSVRRDLRSCLPPELWSKVLVGYYNGAQTAALSDDSVPDGTDAACKELSAVAAALRDNPELREAAKQSDRQFQITLEAKGPLPENRLWDVAQQVLLMTGTPGLKITRSSHSIDIVASSVSKLSVLTSVRDRVDGDILCIGDRGRWPGNDYELLGSPFALSVDEVSVDPATCWNLGLPGQRGISVTMEYLASLISVGQFLQFDVEALQ